MKFSSDNRTRLRASDLAVVVTGATGWLGNAALEMLAEAYGDQFSDRVHAFASSTRTISLCDGRNILCRALSEIRDLPAGDYLFFHFAFLGKERAGELPLPDYAARVLEITELMTGAMRRVGNKGIILPSSGAVYRLDHSLDDDLERNPYGVLKLRDETLFTQLAHDIGVPITIPRIFNLSGPYINKLGSYALSSIVIDLLRNQPIRLQATHPVIRSYVHVGDVLDLTLLSHFARAQGHQTFDTVGEVEIELGDLARMAATLLGRPDLDIIRPALQAAPVNRYVGAPELFRAIRDQFGYPARNLSRQITDTAEFLKGTLATA